MNTAETMFALASSFAIGGLLTWIICRILTNQDRKMAQAYTIFEPVIKSINNRSEFFKASIEVLSKLIPAEGYYVYLPDERGETLIKRFSQREPAAVTPDGYKPPASVSAVQVPNTVMWQGPDFPYLSIPLRVEDQTTGLLLIGPVGERAFPQGAIKRLNMLLPMLSQLYLNAQTLEDVKGKVSELETFVEMGSFTNQSFLGRTVQLDELLSLAVQGIQAQGGCILSMLGDEVNLEAAVGIPDDLLHHLRADPAVLGFDTLTITEGDAQESIQISPSHLFQSAGFQLQWICPLKATSKNIGLICCLFELPPEGTSVEIGERFRTLGILANRIAILIESKAFHAVISLEYLKTLVSMVDFSDSLDTSTRGHSTLVSVYAQKLAKSLGLGAPEIDGIGLAAYLHDIGMLGIVDMVNNTVGRLPGEKAERIKYHTIMGAVMVEPIADPIPLAPLIRHHHERWDGWGYPDGLKGKEIPMGARIIAVADVFTAMVSGRRYRSRLDFDRACSMLDELGGSQLDPELVERFLALPDLDSIGADDGEAEPQSL